MAMFPRNFLQAHISNFFVLNVPAGKPLFLERNWYCLVTGVLAVTRFTTAGAQADKSDSKGQSQVMSADSQADDAGILTSSLEQFEGIPRLTTLRELEGLMSFQHGWSFGPYGDEWLVAKTDVELICLPLRTFSSWTRRFQGRERNGCDVELLRKSPLFQSCPERFLQVALEELLELHEVVFGTDPMVQYPGLLIVRSGQLQLLAQYPQRGGVNMPSADSVEPASNAVELCTLTPGDAIGEEALLGGEPLQGLTSSRVVSSHLEFWSLPEQRLLDAESSGLLDQLKAAQTTNRQAVEKKIADNAAWAEIRRVSLAEVLKGTRGRALCLEQPVIGQLLKSRARPSPKDSLVDIITEQDRDG
jgi:CRP-like cAMP-binding protein